MPGTRRPRGDLLGIAREVALQLEELQQRGKPEARGAGLVADGRTLRGGKSPLLGQILGEQFAPHEETP